MRPAFYLSVFLCSLAVLINAAPPLRPTEEKICETICRPLKFSVLPGRGCVCYEKKTVLQNVKNKVKACINFCKTTRFHLNGDKCSCINRHVSFSIPDNSQPVSGMFKEGHVVGNKPDFNTNKDLHPLLSALSIKKSSDSEKTKQDK
ncbi:hypothetical protein BDB01DRAFT_839221 [Pilobolus umbonatus]|nr:hypothetical protein BDB01DRAFT_839221 [Pilobolus umbonatus]